MTHRRMIALGAIVALLALGRPGQGDEGPTLLAGVARVDVTPAYPVKLTGFVLRPVEMEGVEQRVWVRALALGGDRDGGPVVFVSVETCAVNGDWTDRIAARLATSASLPRARFALSVTHTHTAPALTDVLPFIFQTEVPAEHQARIDRYTRELADAVERAATRALADRVPARVAWGTGRLGFANNRRTIKDGKWVAFGVNPGALVDHTMPVLRVTDLDGRIRALMLGYACHCTAIDGHDNRVSGDWAGYASDALERDHPGAVGLVVIGCGADANPFPRRSYDQARAHGEAAARAVASVLAGSLRPIEGPITARFQTVDLPLAEPPGRAEWVQRSTQPGAVGLHARANLRRLDRGESLPRVIRLPVQTWSFAERFGFIFLGGEVVVDYAVRLRTELKAESLWLAAYCNDVPCYIPSRRVLAEGGYEVDRAMASYDRPTRFDPAVEKRLIEAVHAVVPAAFGGRAGR